MKNIQGLIILVVLLVAAISCEKETYDRPDIAETPVYQVKRYEKEALVWNVNFYKEKDLSISTDKNNEVTTAIITTREDVSDETNYDLTFGSKEEREERRTKLVQAKDDDGNYLWEDEDKTIPVMIDQEIPVTASYEYVHTIKGTKIDGEVIFSGDTLGVIEYVGVDPDYEYKETVEKSSSLNMIVREVSVFN